MKAIMPVILSGVCGIFGLIIAVIISSGMAAPSPTKTTYSLYTGYAHLGAGMTVGLSNLASGLAIGMCGSCGVQDSARQPKLYIGMVLIWSFGSALGLYGLIVALIIAVKVRETPLPCPCTTPSRLAWRPLSNARMPPPQDAPELCGCIEAPDGGLVCSSD